MRCVNLQGTKNAKLFVIIGRDVNILIKFVFC